MFNLKNALIPYPQEVIDRGGLVKVGKMTKSDFIITAKENKSPVFEEALSLLKDNIRNISAINEFVGAYEIVLDVNPDDCRFTNEIKKDSYYVDITENKAILCGYDEGGALYAVITFGQLMHIKGDSVMLPLVCIYDYPAFSERGHFMECRYGSDFMSFDEWKDAIDYFAETKINHLMIGLYGCWGVQYDTSLSEYLYLPFKKYPQLKTPRSIKYYSVNKRKWIFKENVLPKMFEDDYFGKLIAYAKKKNINVYPLFNSLGHNTLIPRMLPETSVVDENGNKTGFGFCTRNSQTYEIMFDLYDEIIDRYLLPNGIDSFEIGMDEVRPSLGIDSQNIKKSFSPICSCEKCKGEDHGQLMVEYIINLAKHLKEKGMKNVYVYHDMLFMHNILNEDFANRLREENLYETIIIDWWSYAKPERLFNGRRDEVNNTFRSIIKPMTGYFHWAMPGETNINIADCTGIARKLGFEGVVAYGSFEYCYDFNFKYLAESAWNPDKAADIDEFHNRYAAINYKENPQMAANALKLVREVMIQGTAPNYMLNFFEYYIHSYLVDDNPYPRAFPAEVFEEIAKDEKTYTEYLDKVLSKSKSALDFFESENAGNSRINDIWKLNAMTYYVHANEFKSLIEAEKNYNNGITDEFLLLEILEDLIIKREKLMKTVEDVRIECNQYHCLRDMSIHRQFLVDMLDYVKNSISKGEKPEFSLTEPSYVQSDLFFKLR